MSTVKLMALPGDDSLFHFLVDSVQDYAIFALDDTGRIATWNRGAESIKGYTADEVIGRHFSLFFGPEDQAAGKPEHLLRGAAEQGRIEDEGWRLRKDGSRFWASVVITALRTDSGQLVGYAKVTRDLTERRLSEQALRRRERQLTETQALAGLGSWEWTVAEDRVVWTDELYRIYGLEPDTFEGTFPAYLERVHPEDRERVRAEIERAYRLGQPFEFEERIVRPDGDVRVLRSRGRVVRDEHGATVQLLGSCLDITTLKAAQEKAVALMREQAARESAEALATRLHFLLRAGEVLASSMDHTATLREVARYAVPALADGYAFYLLEEDGSLERVAAAYADTARLVLTRTLIERYPPRRDAARHVWHVVETGEPAYVPEVSDDVLRAAAQDDEHLALLRKLGVRSFIVAPLAGRTGVIGVVIAVQMDSARRLDENDVWFACELGRHAAAAIESARLQRAIRERNQQLEEQSVELELQTEELQAQVAHNEELLTELEATNEELQQRTLEAEQANRAKSDFLATMSHELRTPLNAIFGYADLIQLGLHGPVTPAQEESLERIKRNQHALLVLINDVLNFAKLEAGGLAISMTDLELEEVVEDLEKVVGPQLREKSLRYEWTRCGAGVRVRGDRERIEQILLNLLTNAIKFTEPGGRIVLSAEPDGREVRIRLSDTGCGIPADRLHAIFDPFVQIGRQPGATGDHGVGLGLAISRDLAAAMGGTLTAESVVGQGSVFTLALQRAEP